MPDNLSQFVIEAILKWFIVLSGWRRIYQFWLKKIVFFSLLHCKAEKIPFAVHCVWQFSVQLLYLALGFCRWNSTLIKYFGKIDFHWWKKTICKYYIAIHGGETRHAIFPFNPSCRFVHIKQSFTDQQSTCQWQTLENVCFPTVDACLFYPCSQPISFCSGSPLCLFLLFIIFRFTIHPLIRSGLRLPSLRLSHSNRYELHGYLYLLAF